MKRLIVLANFISLNLILTSCGTLGGVFEKQNRYVNYDDCKVDFDKSVEENYKDKHIQYSPKLFNFEKDKRFKDFGFIYYLNGICECRKGHDNPYINCTNLEGFAASIFLFNTTTDILITVPTEVEITNYTNVTFVKNFSEDSDLYQDYKYFINNVLDNESSNLKPQELYKFQFKKEETEQFYERFFILTSNNIPFQTILFSKSTSIENVILYKEAIRSFIAVNG